MHPDGADALLRMSETVDGNFFSFGQFERVLCTHDVCARNRRNVADFCDSSRRRIDIGESVLKVVPNLFDELDGIDQFSPVFGRLSGSIIRGKIRKNCSRIAKLLQCAVNATAVIGRSLQLLPPYDLLALPSPCMSVSSRLRNEISIFEIILSHTK